MHLSKETRDANLRALCAAEGYEEPDDLLRYEWSAIASRRQSTSIVTLFVRLPIPVTLPELQKIRPRRGGP
jgi:hypothetical protein